MYCAPFQIVMLLRLVIISDIVTYKKACYNVMQHLELGTYLW